METINLKQKFSKVNEHWHPYIIGELNDNYIKLAKVKGEFVWHQHDEEDELFMVQQGTLFIDFNDKTVEVKPGEVLIVPKGTQHRPYTQGEEEVHLVLIEPKQTKHTGEVITEKTVEKLEWI
ncbi:MAG: cupin domain-containing protein [Bacteroidetes bacterium]|nr:cupin domain-containing protein [Bacteroidota bacterium]